MIPRLQQYIAKTIQQYLAVRTGPVHVLYYGKQNGFWCVFFRPILYGGSFHYFYRSKQRTYHINAYTGTGREQYP